MSINKGLSLVCVALILMAQPAATAISVGQTATVGAKVDGLRVPSGTTLLSPALIETGDTPAVVHLSSGQVLALAQQTSAVVSDVDGGLQVQVQAGNVAYSDQSGEVTLLAENSTTMLNQEGQIQEGERVSTAGAAEGDESLCQLQNWSQAQWQKCTVTDPKSGDCDWTLLEVPMSEVPQYLDINSYLSCKDRNPLGLNCECGIKVIPWWIVGAGAAAAAGLIIIIDDDDPKPASPTTP